MKSCPKCNRTFPDEGQKFCTFDGGLLIAPQAFDPNATIRATSAELANETEKQTSRELPDPNKTIVESYPTVALSRDTGPTGTPNTADISPAPPPAVPPPPPPPAPPAAITSPEVQAEPVVTSESAPTQFVAPTPAPPPPPPPVEPTPAAATVPQSQAAAAAAGAVPPIKKKSKLPLILGGVLLFLFLGGAALAALFVFIVKPRLDAMSANRNSSIEVNNNTNTNTSSNTNTEANSNASVEPSPAATPGDSYVPPANAVAFTISKEKLDGKLSEHYFDFHFYYPDNWKVDPKPGANFVVVGRSLPPNFTQENFAVGWYTSKGTFVGDLPDYPKRVEQLSSAFAKQFPEYKQISEGPTRINSLDGYEFRWSGNADLPEKGPVKLWGRVVFLPTGNEGDTTGATLTMFSTSLAPELQSVDDVGQKGELPMILESFRFGKKQ